jgi:Uma2 family endonuclease
MLPASMGVSLDYDPSQLPQAGDIGPTPAWEIATMFPAQGNWTEEEYLDLTDWSKRGIEYNNGVLEFLPMPTEEHQDIIAYLFDLIRLVAVPKLGKAYFSGLRVKTGPKQFSEPDIVFVLEENFSKRGKRFWTGADLVMEVVSDDPKDHHRDYHLKVASYALAGIKEYWIVDPHERRVSVLSLTRKSKRYAPVGVFGPGQVACSKLIKGLKVDVTACFDAAKL